jgi:hypothetical protein
MFIEKKTELKNLVRLPLTKEEQEKPTVKGAVSY